MPRMEGFTLTTFEEYTTSEARCGVWCGWRRVVDTPPVRRRAVSGLQGRPGLGVGRRPGSGGGFHQEAAEPQGTSLPDLGRHQSPNALLTLVDMT